MSAVALDTDEGFDPKRLPTDILQAAGRGEVTTVSKWLNKGGEPDTLCHELGGYSLLHFAAAKGRVNVAQEVMRRGAQVNLRSRSPEGPGNTALMVAARAGRHELVKLLVEKKAELDLQNFEGSTALIFAAGNAEKDCVQLLLESKANADLRHKDGRTALQVCLPEPTRGPPSRAPSLRMPGPATSTAPPPLVSGLRCHDDILTTAGPRPFLPRTTCTRRRPRATATQRRPR